MQALTETLSDLLAFLRGNLKAIAVLAVIGAAPIYLLARASNLV